MKVFIIAEIGINHNGDMDVAKKLIKQAKKAGADAVKFQSYNTNILIKSDAQKMKYQKINDKTDETQFQMLKRAELSMQQHNFLINECKKNKILFISTPYDLTSANFLISKNLKIIKIASTDANNLMFLRQLVTKNIKLIISTGVSDLKELDSIYFDKIINKNLKKINLLHCVSFYPAPLNELNLSSINFLKKRYNVEVGFSDHSLSLITGALAVVAGANVIEKHFTFDKKANGPDHKASLEFEELNEYIQNIRVAEKTIGSDNKKITKSEKNIKNSMQKSIVASKNISKNTLLKLSDLTTMRPGNGIPPYEVDKIVGTKLLVNIKRFDQIKKSQIKN